MASWYSDTRVPRFSATATSEMYTGETMDTTPMPKPPIMRKTTSWVKSAETAQPMAEMLNISAAMSIVFLRPMPSLSIPAQRTPMMEPMRAQPTYQPVASSSSPNWADTMSVVPEITAVS